MSVLLDVRELSVRFQTPYGDVKAVSDLSFSVDRGEALGVVGESGSGKSVSLLAMLGLLDKRTTKVSGSVNFQGRALLKADPRELRAIRGREIGMIFQDPMSALNPIQRIGPQIAEVIRIHTSCRRSEAHRRAVDLLEMVGIPQPDNRARQYPHQFSGGMRQRVVIAMALALRPALLIADESTTALDVTVQAQILELIRSLRHDLGVTVILVTHDLGVIAQYCDRVQVMYAGRAVETADLKALYEHPAHPYTRGLLNSICRIDGIRARKLRSIPGQPPSLIDLPPGCSFAPRCSQVMARCLDDAPPAVDVAVGHVAVCHLHVQHELGTPS